MYLFYFIILIIYKKSYHFYINFILNISRNFIKLFLETD